MRHGVERELLELGVGRALPFELPLAGGLGLDDREWVVLSSRSLGIGRRTLKSNSRRVSSMAERGRTPGVSVPVYRTRVGRGALSTCRARRAAA
ncbi:hypothetical protein F8O01_11330 [Pseudoclavibacter chungangensis]|uniref:Uncharacterized protein n=1 Tax=Pseudoclavibacter chungangensis TaxID=587635 RepID=A0A7J5BQH1_9MICO|nr:hypothetical protein [Pseudoclavibacter chungangensis]KAB1656021.1 hypothetical protein F8O01_11330 [Pseudoclavibacter chungangensis]NYJ66477.1 hypothetical protein [Pseudoclavibacter chungangensis]